MNPEDFMATLCDECDECEESAQAECAICLQEIKHEAEGTGSCVLKCSHSFHLHCLVQHVQHCLGRMPPCPSNCPLCTSPIDTSTLKCILPPQTAESYVRKQDAALASHSTRRVAAVTDTRAERDFNRWARTNHVKSCPRCRAPIEKHGGCNSMVCRACDQRFAWNQTSLLVACKGYHYSCVPPFVHKCKHFDLDRMTKFHHAMFLVQRYTVGVPYYLPAHLLRAPAAACSLLTKLQSYRQQRKLMRRRAQLQAIANEEHEAAKREAIQCRWTGNHDMVAGWCQRCGAIEVVP